MSAGTESLVEGRSLIDLITAADVRAEQMQNAESEAVGGEIAASQAWFELKSLRSKLRIAQSQAVLIERLTRG